MTTKKIAPEDAFFSFEGVVSGRNMHVLERGEGDSRNSDASCRIVVD